MSKKKKNTWHAYFVGNGKRTKHWSIKTDPRFAMLGNS